MKVARLLRLTRDAAHTVDDIVDHLLANGVMAARIVVGGILLAADKVFRMEERAVRASANLVNWPRVEVDEERAGNMLATARLGEEGLERTGVADIARVGVRTTIGTKPVL